ncbi:MAG: 3-phosphoshikimate 1-carboxyvinyltransferase [Promethearchaeota archaeon]
MEAVIEGIKDISGSIEAPTSKSYSHRAIIASSLCNSESKIRSPLYCDDTEATIDACSAFGAKILKEEEILNISGPAILSQPDCVIDCRDSASTIRFMTSIAALTEGVVILTGKEGLLRRPIEPLIKSLADLGVKCYSKGGYPPVTIYGNGIKGGRTSLVGNISSQFVTSLLLAAPLAKKDTRIILETRLVSRPYVELTLQILKRHSIRVEYSKDLEEFHIAANQIYKPFNHDVPGSYSSASFLLVAAAITNSHLKVKNLSSDKWLPDKKILEILGEMGVNLKIQSNNVEILGGDLTSTEIDARDTPDLVPICSVLGCFAEGETRIVGASRIRYKESDRIATTTSELNKMGAKISETEDGLRITGNCSLHGTSVDPHNDHRIAMACSVAALRAEGKTKIQDAECVKKSYPNFFKDLIELGVNIDVR